jgi:DNA-binding beta-propeller fold protein YncE
MVACGVAVESIAAAKPQNPEYHLLNRVSLGGEGRWDYFAVEPGTHRVFIPRRTHIMVLDPQGKVLDDLKFPGMKNAHGIVFAPELKRAFTTNGDDKSVTIFNPDTLKLIETVKLPDRAPDGILYDPASERVFTQNDDPNTDATAIDAKTGKVLGNIPLPDKAETAQADGEGHVYVNIEDKAEMTEFNSKTLKVLHTWPLAPCKTPTGLSIDTAHKRLFAGCRSGVVAVVDYTNGKVVATWPIGQGVDATRFDPQTQLVFASCGDGTITVAHEDSPDRYTKVQTITTEPGARTMALDEGNHNIYTVTSNFGPAPTPTKDEPHPRPTPIPSTFRMLIYGR